MVLANPKNNSLVLICACDNRCMHLINTCIYMIEQMHTYDK